MSAPASERYDEALGHLVRYRPDVVDATMSLVDDEPDFAMGHALAAYLSLTSTDVPDLDGARASGGQLERLARTDQERAHCDAVNAWLAGDWHGAAQRLDDHLIEQPDDVLALLVGHQLDFFQGDAQNLRDRVGRSLGRIDPQHPEYGFVRGMYAFGLEEAGHYDLAEAHGLAAVGANPDDVWATHAVVHVYEMRGQVETGIGFLRQHESDWTANNMFTVHNWWHLALYLLEAGRVDDALAVYDARIHNGASAGVPLEMLDADRAAVAAAARRSADWRPLRRTGRRLGHAYDWNALVRLQRRARHDGPRRRRPPGRCPRRHRPSRPLRRRRSARTR